MDILKILVHAETFLLSLCRRKLTTWLVSTFGEDNYCIMRSYICIYWWGRIFGLYGTDDGLYVFYFQYSPLMKAPLSLWGSISAALWRAYLPLSSFLRTSIRPVAPWVVHSYTMRIVRRLCWCYCLLKPLLVSVTLTFYVLNFTEGTT